MKGPHRLGGRALGAAAMLLSLAAAPAALAQAPATGAPRPDTGAGTPSPAGTGSATPPPADTGSATPPPADTGSATPPPADTGSATPPPADTGSATPPPAAPPPAAGPVLALSDCVSYALAHNPDVLTSDKQVDEARASRAETAGHFGPKVQLDGNLQIWDGPFQINFGGGSIQVRDQFTWTASASLIQPLTPLFVIYDEYKLRDYGVDVAQIQKNATRRDVAFRVAEAYLRLLEATRLSSVATTSVDELMGQQRQAESLHQNGVIGKNDLLRAVLAVANARQLVIQSRGMVTLAQGRLEMLMGRRHDAPFEPVPYTNAPPPLEPSTVADAETQAATKRMELVSLDRRIDQAGMALSVAKLKLLPQVNAMGTYQHFDGSAFQQHDAAFVGLTGTWDIWDWGTTWNGIKEARARKDQAQLARTKLEDEVRLEARQAFVNANTARDALAVAKTAVTQAEENYRIVTKRFQAAAGTSFDVVDAETLLTRARAQVETATYDYLIARSALQRATGATTPRL